MLRLTEVYQLEMGQEFKRHKSQQTWIYTEKQGSDHYRNSSIRYTAVVMCSPNIAIPAGLYIDIITQRDVVGQQRRSNQNRQSKQGAEPSLKGSTFSPCQPQMGVMFL